MSAAVNGTPAGGALARVLRPAAQTTYEKVFGTVYAGLMVNVMLALACSPLLVALAIVRNPLASWPFFLALAGLCAPALTGAFGCFAGLGEDGSTVVLRPFLAAYRATFRRAAGIGFAGCVAVGLLVADALFVAGTAWGPVLVPFFVTASALVVAVVVAVLVALAENPAAALRDLVRPSLYAVARMWYLAAANVVVLMLVVGIVLMKPVVGVLVACSPLLYVVWANTRYLLAPRSTSRSTP
jgi:uncharacterized membrane protein YesL